MNVIFSRNLELELSGKKLNVFIILKMMKCQHLLLNVRNVDFNVSSFQIADVKFAIYIYSETRCGAAGEL